MRSLTLGAALALAPALMAEHLPGGSITTRCIGNNQHEVTLTLWRECSGAPMIAQNLSFTNNCGVSFSINNVPLIATEEVSPICPDQQDQTTCEGGTLLGIEQYTYRTTLFLSPCNAWTIGWNTCCRNESVNLEGAQGIYIEALVNNAGGACNSSPVFSDQTPPFVCVDQPVSYDPGVVNNAGQQLRFRLIGARRYTGIVDPVLYQAPYTGAEPFTGMVIDSLTGSITFTPTLQGYIVCVIQVEVRNAAGQWIGTIMRDFPFIAQACGNTVPSADSGVTGGASGNAASTGPYAVTSCGGAFCFEATVADGDPGQVLTLSSNVDQVLPGSSFTVTGTNPAVAAICWNSAGAAAGNYVFTITALDDACPVRGAQTYTYTLTVGTADATAGPDATATLCPGTGIDLTSLMTGDAGGTWSAGPLVTEPGVYTYTITSACGEDEAVFTIEPGDAPDAGPDATTTICAGGSVDLNGLVLGQNGGVWSNGAPIASEAGTYTYTVTNACGADEASFFVSVAAPPDPGIDNAVDVCPIAGAFTMLDSLLGTPEPGGAWFSPDNSSHGPAFDPSIDPAGVYCYRLPGTAPCPDTEACLTITLLPPSDPYCIWLGGPELAPEPLIAPNPSAGQLRLNGLHAAHAEVIDVSGRIVFRAALASAQEQWIDLPSTLSQGEYLLKATRHDGTATIQRFNLVR